MISHIIQFISDEKFNEIFLDQSNSVRLFFFVNRQIAGIKINFENATWDKNMVIMPTTIPRKYLCVPDYIHKQH